ncbi:MAG: hypothetical protein A3F68_08795 [Acidobacteria bacterium RIFCSPLOWO2_12_FULL_54_10]|nr:MAG: hypothetical protein A3F68_08795 [Acidobacteria bacterium RIFCSPLOWO2_12_FULL_54_10]
MSMRFRQPSSFCFPIAGVLLLLALAGGMASAQELTWWTTHALIKVRPNDTAPAGSSRSAELFAGRNEFEPFQVVLRVDQSDLEDVDVQVSDLSGPSGGSITRDNITIYLEGYLNLESPSSIEGDAGEWPDPLFPRVDRYAGERRNAFPFRLRRGRNQPVWIEIYVPPGTSPGTYSGAATITARNSDVVSIPITMHVWDFGLPSTSSLKTSFGLSGVAALKQHRGRYTSDDDLDVITFLYAKAALWHRISIHGGTHAPPPFSGRGQALRLDWTRYDREVGPFLDGTVFGKGEPLDGARATSVDLRTHRAADTDEKKISYWQRWVNHFADHGWLSRLFYYTWDEPPSQINPKVQDQAELAHRADPRIRNLVTTSFDQSLQGAVDIWAPLINCIDGKPGFPDFCERMATREVYDAEIQRGRSLWWYQSCASHGCKVSRGDYFRGWPSYVIDIAAVANRIMPWLSWRYKVEGELYFSMNEAFSQDVDAWENIYLFGGNGDGTLFYPGRPDQIGGTSDIPIESIRLKLIREGLEDYEYLVLLSRRGLSDFAEEEVCQIITKVYQWDRDPEKLYAVRRALGERLSASSNQTKNTENGGEQGNRHGAAMPQISLPCPLDE